MLGRLHETGNASLRTGTLGTAAPKRLPYTDFVAHKPMTLSNQIRDFLHHEGSTIVSVEFTKKDGTLRTIQFNPRDRQEIKGTGTKTDNPNIIKVRDFDIARNNNGIGAWRSFDVNRITRIKSRGMVYNFTA
jgi:hypothetical protein